MGVCLPTDLAGWRATHARRSKRKRKRGVGKGTKKTFFLRYVVPSLTFSGCITRQAGIRSIRGSATHAGRLAGTIFQKISSESYVLRGPGSGTGSSSRRVPA